MNKSVEWAKKVDADEAGRGSGESDAPSFGGSIGSFGGSLGGRAPSLSSMRGSLVRTKVSVTAMDRMVSGPSSNAEDDGPPPASSSDASSESEENSSSSANPGAIGTVE